MVSRVVFTAFVIASLSSYALCDEPSPQADATIKLLKQATSQLEAAVKTAQEIKVNERTEEESDAVAAQIEAISAQLELLRKAAGPKQLQIQIRCLEMPVADAARVLGFENPEKISSPNQPIRKNAESLANDLAALTSLHKLAEPTIVTTDRRPARFHSGGEFPILIPAENGTTSIEWRKFGTQCEVVPVLRGEDNISLELQVEISERDFNNSVTLNGGVVPGLTSRCINTRAELEFGETLIFSLPDPHGAKDRVGADGTPVPTMATVILVTPERVDAVAKAAKASPIQRVSGELPIGGKSQRVVPAAK